MRVCERINRSRNVLRLFSVALFAFHWRSVVVLLLTLSPIRIQFRKPLNCNEKSRCLLVHDSLNFAHLRSP